MRISKLLLPVAAAAALAAAAAAPASAASPVSSSYLWAQWNTAVVANPLAQLPAWILTTPRTLTLSELPVMTSYTWAQLDTAPTHVVQGSPWSL